MQNQRRPKFKKKKDGQSVKNFREVQKNGARTERVDVLTEKAYVTSWTVGREGGTEFIHSEFHYQVEGGRNLPNLNPITQLNSPFQGPTPKLYHIYNLDPS